MLLPRSEQESLREEDNNKDEIAILGDRDCERPKAISRLKPKYCQEVFKLPIRASNPELPLWFSSVLRNVYARDYDMPNIMQFGTSDNQIVQEGFVFRSMSERQYVFVMGNFIQLQNGRIAQIDQIFVHELNHRDRLFCKFTLVQYGTNPAHRDPVLKLQMHCFVTLQTATIIVGLPERLYILPVNLEDKDWCRRLYLEREEADLMLVDYNVKYL